MHNAIRESLCILEVVMRYAHPTHGIVVRNEVSAWGTNVPFAAHTVDLYDPDVPIFCYQLISMGSDVVDFLTAPRFVHELKGANLYYDLASEARDLFKRWINYRREESFAKRSGEAPEPPAAAGILVVLELEEGDSSKFTAAVL